ncbi:MAG TPA: hypothetical protein VEI98_05225, partial [Xanthobacteraceae bacterium]|nr:hypothetical protein [Xanthobacteraceae bacterium]
PGWEGRIGTRRFFTNSYAQAAGYSRARREALDRWDGPCVTARFDWVQEPVLNPYTRLAVVMCPAAAILRAVGYDRAGGPLPEPVTATCEIALTLESWAA